jgi:hypothetical protein
MFDEIEDDKPISKLGLFVIDLAYAISITALMMLLFGVVK